MMNDDSHWKFDRRIPIAVMIALLMQAAGALIWATELDARVEHIERQSSGSSSNDEKFGRIEERLDSIKENIDAMKRQIDHLTYRLIKNSTAE